MKTAALICEFNPFHTGHAYILRTLKESCGFDRIVCVMSGNYVQRGEPAVLDKYQRAESALIAGADLVLELPAEYSAASAGDFARGAVSLILSTGLCTHLCFGAEPGFSADVLNSIRRKENAAETVTDYIKQGKSYPEAVSLSAATGQIPSNARLGIEYLNALDYFSAADRILPFPVERKGDPYLSESPTGTSFASATALRRLILDGNGKDAEKWLPYSLDRMSPCSPDLLTDLLNDRLLRDPDLFSYQDVSREIADRLRKLRFTPMSFTERTEALWTRQYTRSRISRALLHIVLGIRKNRVRSLKENGYTGYLRVLGCRTDSLILTDMKRTASLPIFSRNSRFYEAYPDALYYDQIWHNVTGTGTELTRSPVIW